jgi:ISXO2-like transposase domain
MGSWVRVSVLWSGGRRLVADARRAAPLLGLSLGDFGHRRHDLRRDADAAGELVRGDLVRRQPEAGRVRVGAPAGAGAGQLPDRVGVAAQAPARDGAARARAAGRSGRGRRNLRRSKAYERRRPEPRAQDDRRDRGRRRGCARARSDATDPQRQARHPDRLRARPRRSRHEVRTDAWTGYDEIGRYRFSHVVVNLSSSGDPAHVVLPHVHLVASLLKRWILGTHQGAVSRSQLDYYLDEFTFRFNRRRAHHRGLLFYRLLQGAIAAEPHPYKTLTSQSAK